MNFSPNNQANVAETIARNPTSAYVHIPFCRHRCGYCNFALVADRDYLIDRFLDALEIELCHLEQRYHLQTLFLGGGTPTHLSGKQLERLFKLLDQHFDFCESEITSEANPGDLSADKIKLLSDLGVNRFSLGVQSFHDGKLRLLERDHSADQVRSAVKELQRYTNNISLDLIFATMNESLTMWQKDLRQAIELEPKHLSTYELTIEKGTQFWKRHRHGELVETNEDLRAEMYSSAIEMLASHGLEQYEISSFAANDYQCQHNLIYWSGKPFLAFGAGAASYLNGIRKTNYASVSTYIKRLEAGQSPVAFSEQLPPDLRARELLVIGLRRISGVDENEFRELTGVGFDQVLNSEQSRPLFEHGLLDQADSKLTLTSKGVLLYDSIAEAVLSVTKDN